MVLIHIMVSIIRSGSLGWKASISKIPLPMIRTALDQHDTQGARKESWAQHGLWGECSNEVTNLPPFSTYQHCTLPSNAHGIILGFTCPET